MDLVAPADRPRDIGARPGGSPLNVAVTVGRLGQRVRLATQLGPDDYGRQITAHLEESGVSFALDPLTLPRTSTALALIEPDGSATYQFDLAWTLAAPLTASGIPGIVHTGSIAATQLPGAATVLEMVRRARLSSLVTYDPNIRPSIMPPRRQTQAVVEEYVWLADLVKVSKEDLEWLYPGQSVEGVIDHWFLTGAAQLVVVTSGRAGASAWTRCGNTLTSAPFPVRVADTVGAGDSFMGALICQLLSRGMTGRSGARRLGSAGHTELTEILWVANQVAAQTVSRVGADPPWQHELRGCAS